jgi:hypothetical protein
MEWFDAYRRGLSADIDATIDALKTAHPDDKDELRALKTKYEGKVAKLANRQEEFFNDQTLSLIPPDQNDIARTKELTVQMDALIREQKRAEAVAQTLNDLADLLGRIAIDV